MSRWRWSKIVQAGSIGLIRACDRFDPGRGVTFATFATPAIEGEIRRHLGDHAGVRGHDHVAWPHPLLRTAAGADACVACMFPAVIGARRMAKPGEHLRSLTRAISGTIRGTSLTYLTELKPF